jgi:formiminotetrahydrofolate cyclodeaminase
MRTAAEATELGNANAASDGLSAAHALYAAAHGALANVAINAAGLKDEEVAGELRTEAEELTTAAGRRLAAAESAFAARIA